MGNLRYNNCNSYENDIRYSVGFNFEIVEHGNNPTQGKYKSSGVMYQALLAVQPLSEEERKCYNGIEHDSKSLRQMAIELGLDKHTIKKRLESARSKIAKAPLDGDEATCKQALRIACSMPKEMIKSIVGHVIDFESLRQMATELGRDKHTIKRRLESACDMIRQSPLGASLRLEFDNMNILSF